MERDTPHGYVLVLAEDRKVAERLEAWISATGERVRASYGDEIALPGDPLAPIELVVTDLNAREDPGRALLHRMTTTHASHSPPQIHLLREVGLQPLLFAAPPPGVTWMPSPPEAGEFKERVRLACALGRARRELRRLDLHDPATGLYNRRYVLHRLEEEFARARRHRSPLSLVLLDIDQLKKINQAYGRHAGDAAIRLVSEVVHARVRIEDVVGRLGDGCFAVVLPGNRYRGAAVFASNIRTETDDRRLAQAPDLHVSVSAGVSCYPDNTALHSAEHLHGAAEHALSEAKRRGGNRVFIDEAVLQADKRLLLVIDPDRELLEAAEDLLSLDDFRVVLSDTPQSAMETLRFRRPDLLVVDLQMGDSERGSSLIEQIQDMFPGERFPIVGLSRDPDTDPDGPGRLGVDRFITKPFSPSLLRSVVRELLDTYQPLTL